MSAPIEIRTYSDNNGNEFSYNAMLPCPFCGGVPVIIPIGNNATRKRSAKIKCDTCRVERTDGAIYHNQEWCMQTCIDQWNKRVQQLTDKTNGQDGFNSLAENKALKQSGVAYMKWLIYNISMGNIKVTDGITETVTFWESGNPYGKTLDHKQLLEQFTKSKG